MFEALYADMGDGIPHGLILHAAYEREGRVMHLDVWETEADFERFSAERLRPAVGRMLAKNGIRFEDLPPPAHADVDLIRLWSATLNVPNDSLAARPE
jgi:hypothetical protein